MPFAWTINPYRGCEFGCVYCFARYTHEFMELDPVRGFEDRIFAKPAAAPALRLEAVRRLAEAGISVGVFASPVTPLLTGTEERLEALAAAAADAGSARTR